MKSTLQALACAAALAVLASGAAAQATDVAELPLKASVLAKPNLIFGLDDSGSMDAEFMLNSNNGYFWWNYATGVGYTGGRPIFGGAGNEWALFYLFPNGTGAGNRVYGDPDSRYGYGVPPTPELAWLRSPDYNQIYFNPARRYVPWSPGHVNGALRTYANADPAAARSHPANGSGTVRLDATLDVDDGNWRFTWLNGMTVPAGVTGLSCIFGAAPAATALPWRVDAARGLCKGRMAYYPATYWLKRSCTANGTSCVAAPDGATLQRFEIRPANYASSAEYTAEMQNFANWFTYYRKRRLMLGAAMGGVLENLTGLRMGVVDFNDRRPVTMWDADATNPANNRFRVAGEFQTAEGGGGTPTRETLKYIGDQFNRTDTDGLGNRIVQFACQRNAAFVVTDGFAAANSVSPPSYSASVYGAGAPYQTTFSGSLADIALSYYTNRLRTDLTAGRVPRDDPGKVNSDQNPNLHMNTYALTLGARGFLWPGAPDPFVTAPTWVNPTAQDQHSIDDLWHATINGRGQMYRATDVQETATGIRAALDDILSSSGAQGGVAVSTVNLTRGDGYAYLGSYNPAGWSGDLTANAIDAVTGTISTTPTWSASARLTARAWTDRVIAGSTASGGAAFTVADFAASVNPGGAWGADADVIAYLAGDRSKEGTQFRSRTSLLGAVINAEPAISRDDNVVYVASGEGMLHAFDITKGSADVGKELWAFVPRPVLADLGQTTSRGYAFRTQLDGTPVVGKSGSASKLLVAGMGAAGRSYYALDVSSPRGHTAASLAAAWRWEFPSASDAVTRGKVGQTLGRPAIVRTAADGYVVLVTSGYNSTADGRGRLWMLDSATGAIVTEFTVPDGTLTAESGLAHVSPYQEDDGTVRYVYGGDLLGNVWRFDLVAKDAPVRIAVLKDAAGNRQPVTAAPELAFIAGRRVVLLGTGRILGLGDFGNTRTQTFYAISDGAAIDPARGSLVQQTYARSTDTLSSNAVDWSARRGWFMDLPAGEHANTRPTLAYGAVGFVTNVTGASDCSAQSWFYVIDVASGSRSPNAGFVSSQISDTANSSAPTAVVTAAGDVRGLAQTADGRPVERRMAARPTILPSKNAWREVKP